MEDPEIDFKKGTSSATRNLNTQARKNGTGIYAILQHSTFRTALDLMVLWKRLSGVFFVDINAGIKTMTAEAYLRKNFKDKFDLVKVDKTTNLSRNILKYVSVNEHIVFIGDQTLNTIFLKLVAAHGLLDSNRTWILGGNIGLDIPVVQQETQITVIVANSIPTSKQVSENAEIHTANVYDVFYCQYTNKLKRIKFAEWTATKGLFVLEDLEEQDRVDKLRGKTVRSVGWQYLPFVAVSHVDKIPRFSGYIIDALKAVVEDDLKAKLLATEEMAPIWGSIQNGTFIGLTGRLYRRESDLGIVPIASSLARVQGMRFVSICSQIDMTLMYRMPEVGLPTNAHWMTFPNDVWLVAFSLLLLVAATIAAMRYWSPGWTSDDNRIHSSKFDMITLTFFVDALQYPPGGPSKMAYFSLLMAVLMSFLLYSAELFASLSNQGIALPLQSLEDMAQQNEYIPVLIKNTLYAETFQNSEKSEYRALWRLTLEHNKSFVDTLKDAVGLIFKGKYGCIFDGNGMRGLLHDQCSVVAIKLTSPLHYVYVTSRLDFPYSRMVYMSMLRLFDGGAITRLKRKYQVGVKPVCSLERGNLSFGLNQVLVPFLVLIGGSALAFLVLIVEKLIQTY